MQLAVHALLSFASLSYSLQRQVQLPVAPNDSLDVPGNNPLVFCEDPKDYILDIDHIDVEPDPLKA
jgi:hypothetical protein